VSKNILLKADYVGWMSKQPEVPLGMDEWERLRKIPDRIGEFPRGSGSLE
jgi:hypothetical protein